MKKLLALLLLLPSLAIGQQGGMWNSPERYNSSAVGITGGTISGVGGDTMSSDAAARSNILKGSDAYPQATVNTAGGNAKVCAGIGRRFFTIVGYTLIDAIDTVTVTVNGSATVKTAGGTDWTAATSNAATATSLASAVNAISGVTAVASGSSVYITPASTTCTLTIATSMDAGEGTATSGTDGTVTVGGTIAFGTPVAPSSGGTGVANNDAATFTRSGNHALTITTSGAADLNIGTGGTLGTSAYTATATPTTLGLVIGTNVQAYDADLTTWAGITPGTNVGTALAVAVGTDGAFVTKGGALGTPSSADGTNITNVNAATLGGATFAAPGAIGGGTPSTGAFTSGSFTGNLALAHVGFGTSAVAGVQAVFFESVVAANAKMIQGTSTLTPGLNSSSQGVYLSPNFVEHSSGNHGSFATVYIDTATVTSGAATTSNTYGLYIEGAMSATVSGANYAIGVNSGNVLFNGGLLMPNLETGSAATVGTLCQTATTGNITVNTTLACLASSERYKQNIHDLDMGLPQVMALRPVAYELKPEFNPTGLGEMPGLVAEEVEKVDARLVGMNADGKTVEGVRYMQMTALLVKAIQEQQAQIDKLTTRLAEIEGARTFATREQLLLPVAAVVR